MKIVCTGAFDFVFSWPWVILILKPDRSVASAVELTSRSVASRCLLGIDLKNSASFNSSLNVDFCHL